MPQIAVGELQGVLVWDLLGMCECLIAIPAKSPPPIVCKGKKWKRPKGRVQQPPARNFLHDMARYDSMSHLKLASWASCWKLSPTSF